MLTVVSAGDREAATDFVGRVAQLDPTALVRLIADDGAVHLWAKGGFGVMAGCVIAGDLAPSPLTAYASDLIGGLAIARTEHIDTGADARDQWTGQLPPTGGWTIAGRLSARAIADRVASALVDAKIAVEQERVGELSAATKATVPPRLLDAPLMTVDVADGRVPVSMRMLFALSGMGFVGGTPDGTAGGANRTEVTDHDHDHVLVCTTRTWLRLDTEAGSVARRRMADLPPE